MPDVDQAHETFDQQGYVILRGFFEQEILHNARFELEKLVDQHAERLMAEGKITDPLEDEPFETRLARLYKTCLDEAPKNFRRELHLAGLFDLFFHPHLLDVKDRQELFV